MELFVGLSSYFISTSTFLITQPPHLVTLSASMSRPNLFHYIWSAFTSLFSTSIPWTKPLHVKSAVPCNLAPDFVSSTALLSPNLLFLCHENFHFPWCNHHIILLITHTISSSVLIIYQSHNVSILSHNIKFYHLLATQLCNLLASLQCSHLPTTLLSPLLVPLV